VFILLDVSACTTVYWPVYGGRDEDVGRSEHGYQLHVGDGLAEELAPLEEESYLPGELRQDVEESDEDVGTRQVGNHRVHPTQFLRAADGSVQIMRVSYQSSGKR